MDGRSRQTAIVTFAPRTFRPQPVAPEARRALLLNVGGSLFGVVLLATLAIRAATPGLRAAFFGMIVATFYLLARTAREWRRETRFAQNATLTLQPKMLQLVDELGKPHEIAWRDVKLEAQTARVVLSWPGGEMTISAREWGDGAALLRELSARAGRDKPPFLISLEAKS